MTTRLSFPPGKPLVVVRPLTPRVFPHGSLRIHLPRIRNRVKVHATDQKKQREQEEMLLKVMKERVEDAAELLDGIIDDIVCELSSVQAMGYIYQEVPESTEKQIIKKVVKSFLARLDQNFLASLEKFEQKARDMGNIDVAILISKINKEVMHQVQEHFPPEVLLLEDLMKMSDKKERINKIKGAYEKEVNSKHESTQVSEEVKEATPKLDLSDLEDIPVEELDLKQELERLKVLKTESGLKQLKEELAKEQTTSEFDDVLNSMEDNPLDDCLEDADDDEEEDSIKEDYGKKIDPMQLFMAADQFISDMEEKEEVANRQLLAKLCVIREEARLVELEMRFKGVKLPEDPTKMRKNVPSQVMGVIQACVKSSDTMNRVGLIRKAFEKDVYGPSEKDVDRAPGFVRPGMFMTALTMVQMEADLNSKMQSTKSQYTPEFLQRLDDIRLEAMLVLKDMGWGEFRSEELSKRQKEKESSNSKQPK